jgi:uncharacterized membrane protein YeaQ/YmgE (transglycosylase-associated protein family)
VSVAVLTDVLVAGGGAGWLAGRLLQRRRPGQVLDSIQGAAGAALCLEVFALTGSLPGGLGELVVLAMLGAWVAVGTSHAMAAVMHRAGLAGGSDEA